MECYMDGAKFNFEWKAEKPNIVLVRVQWSGFRHYTNYGMHRTLQDALGIKFVKTIANTMVFAAAKKPSASEEEFEELIHNIINSYYGIIATRVSHKALAR